jgi:hypothetical protein
MRSCFIRAARRFFCGLAWGFILWSVILTPRSALAVAWNRVGTVTTMTNGQICRTDGTNIICDNITPSILSTGSVGIGSTAPIVSLDLSKRSDALALPVGSTEPTSPVNGMIRYSTTYNDLESYINGAWTTLTTGGDSAAIYLGTSAAATDPSRNGDATTGLFSAATSTVSVAVGGVEAMRVISTGSVGIGTASPTSALDVQFPGNVIQQLKATTNTSSALLRFISAGTGLVGLESSTGGSVIVGGLPYAMVLDNQCATCSLQLATNNTAQFTVKSSGSVGIGTSAPLSKLDISGNLAIGTAYAGLTAAPTDGMIVAGSVGIGTNSPLASLHLYGASNVYPVIRMSGTAGGVNSQIQSYTNGASHYGLQIQNGAGTPILSIDNGSSGVAIGTTTSLSKLDIAGNTAIGTAYAGVTAAPTDGMIVAGSVGIGTTTPVSQIQVIATDSNNSSLTNVLTLSHYTTIGTGSAGEATGLAFTMPRFNGGINTYSSIQSIYTGTGTGLNDTGDLSFSTKTDSGAVGLSEKLRITSSGRVGIGTSAPLSKLDISGNIAIGTAYAGLTAAPTDGMIVAGSVGIGTASPTAMLNVYSNTSGVYPTILINNGSAAQWPVLQMVDARTGGNGWNIENGRQGGNLDLFAAGFGQVMTLTSGGRVGIGTSSPLVSLDLSQKTDAVALPVGTAGARPTGSNVANGDIRYNSSGTGAVEAYINSSWQSLLAGNLSSGLILGTSASVTNPQRSGDPTTGLFSPAISTVAVSAAGTQELTVTNTGVGIGTSSPAQALSVGSSNQFTVSSAGSVIAQSASIGGSATVAPILVTGITVPSGANGLYAYAGQLNGKNYYQSTTVTWYIWWGSNQWFINNNLGNWTSYGGYLSSTATLPPLTSSWGLQNISGSITTSGGSGNYVAIDTHGTLSTGGTLTQSGTGSNSLLGNTGVGTTAPLNKVDVYGAVAVGSSYAGVNTAPPNGMLVAGSVGVGTASPASGMKVDINGPVKVAGTGSEACSMSTLGAMRYNATGNYMEICTYP